jgi:hypothetical protein
MHRAIRTAALLLAVALAGCGDNLVNSRMFYVSPNFNRPEDKSCEDLEKLIKAKDAEVKTIEARIAKAERDTGGGVVATIAHRPSLAPAQAERYALREIAQKKGCGL